MTNHHDPIEAWLSKDVELLPPPQGSFERVRRRARRRKAIQAAGVAAAAAVVVVAAISLPQLAGNLLRGTSTPQNIATGKSSAGSPTPSHITKHHKRHASAAPRLPLSSAGQGARLPAGFRPTSVTFINGGSLGAVIGQGGPSCGPIPCTFVAGTSDYGRTWTKIAGPRAGPPAGDAGVSQLRFADPSNGWAFGPALLATHDGGLTWKPVTTSGPVVDLAAAGGRVFAVAATGCTGTGANYAVGCTRFTLSRAATSADQLTQLTSGNRPVTPGGLQLTQSYGYLLAGGQLYAGPISGSWAPVHLSAASPAAPPCLTSRFGHGLIAPTPASSPTSGTLYLACTAASGRLPGLYASPDGGRTWQSKGRIPVPGNAAATSLAVSPAGPLVLATTGGIYYSGDARNWHLAVGGAFRFVGMTTATNGVAVPTDAALHEVFVTRDGGQRWVRSVIR